MIRSPVVALANTALENLSKMSALKLGGSRSRKLWDSRTPSRVSAYSTQSSVIQSPYSDVVLPQCTLPDLIWEGVESFPDRTALECGITGKSYTYSEVMLMSKKLSASLLKMGFKPGEVVTVILPNIPEFPIAILGSMEAGLTVSTISPIYTAEEISNQLKDSKSSGVIAHSSLFPVVAAATKKCQSNIPIICTKTISNESTPTGAIDFCELVTGDIDTSGVSSVSQRIDLDSTSYLPYSSGTTGLPKGVCLTHRSIVANLAQINHPQTSHFHQTTKEHQDTVPGVLPFYHIYGSSVVMLQSLMRGAKLVTLPKFDPMQFLNILENNKEIILFVVPPMVLFLGSHPAVTQKHLDSVRSGMSGGAPCGAKDIERVMKRKEFCFMQAYGMTESSPVLTIPPFGCSDRATIGPPISRTQAKVTDINTGETLPIGQTGELCFKGPQIMKEYHQRPEATAETIKDGWLHTGDIGYFNEQGYIYIADRIKELIKVKGFQVPPAELEAVLRQHPQVADAGVVGAPCSRSGEKPVAFIVNKPGVPPVNMKELQDFVSERVAPYKKISDFHIIETVPKNASGKIMRRELKELVKNLK